MRLHDRLVLQIFLRVIILCVISFVVIFVLADLFEKIDDFIDHQAPWTTVLRFYVFKLPEIVRLTLPVDVLLATLFTLGVLAKNNEIVALLASGVSLLRVASPILVLAVCAVGVSGLLAEKVVPETNARMLRLRRVEIDKRPPADAPIRHDFSYRGAGGFLYYVRVLNLETRRMSGVTVHQYRGGRVLARLDAQSAEWKEGGWEFRDGFYRTFAVPPAGADSAAAPPERAEPFHVLRLPELQDTPEDLARIEPEPDAMNHAALQRYVERVRASGGPVNDFLVDLHSKVSYPFTCLVLAVLGVGLSASKRKASLAAGFGLTLVISFSYLALSEIGAALGKNETLPPLLAAWIGQLLFGAVGLVLMVRANR
jgi:lipopolysaccharide export system permease protein